MKRTMKLLFGWMFILGVFLSPLVARADVVASVGLLNVSVPGATVTGTADIPSTANVFKVSVQQLGTFLTNTRYWVYLDTSSDSGATWQNCGGFDQIFPAGVITNDSYADGCGIPDIGYLHRRLRVRFETPSALLMNVTLEALTVE